MKTQQHGRSAVFLLKIWKWCHNNIMLLTVMSATSLTELDIRQEFFLAKFVCKNRYRFKETLPKNPHRIPRKSKKASNNQLMIIYKLLLCKFLLAGIFWGSWCEIWSDCSPAPKMQYCICFCFLKIIYITTAQNSGKKWNTHNNTLAVLVFGWLVVWLKRHQLKKQK